MMKPQFLCPVYWKWLQLHPEQARQTRLDQQEKAQQFILQGRPESARQPCGQAYEAAKAAVLSLHATDTSKNQYNEDVLALGAMAIYLSQCLRRLNEHHQALNILMQTQQLLVAQLSLHQHCQQTGRLIQAVIKALAEGISHASQSSQATVLH